MRYRLRTLLIVLALLPLVLAGAWLYYVDYRARKQWEDIGGPGLIDTSGWGTGCTFDEIEGPHDDESPALISN
jgi:hypothetical protein